MQNIGLELTQEQTVNRVLINTIKMLTNRGFFDDNKIDDNIKKAISNKNPELVFKLDSDSSDETYYLKIIPEKIKKMNKTTFGNFFKNNIKDHKIIVIKEIAANTAKYIKENYPGTEIFLENELLINIADNHLIPIHIPLTSEEKDNFFSSYHVKKKSIPHISVDDPVARYYNVKIGDIIKIIRTSDTGGYAVGYRIVVPSPN